MYIIPTRQPVDAGASPVVLDHERVAAIVCPRERVAQVARLLAAAVDAVKVLREVRRQAVRELRQQRTAVADVAALVGVSPQRVSQLAAGERGHQVVAA